MTGARSALISVCLIICRRRGWRNIGPVSDTVPYHNPLPIASKKVIDIMSITPKCPNSVEPLVLRPFHGFMQIIQFDLTAKDNMFLSITLYHCPQSETPVFTRLPGSYPTELLTFFQWMSITFHGFLTLFVDLWQFDPFVQKNPAEEPPAGG